MALVEVTYFTDPYCSWCWATEPMLYRIRETYREQVHIRYVMGGLVKDMAEFYDALNDIRTTAQVAPHWRMVSERSGQPIDEGLMEEITDPHFSTWPACIAVKAAQLQGEEVGERFLRRLRRAALTERKVISYREVQEALAQEVPGLDLERWRKALDSGQAERAFQEDLAECRRYGVTGFPTLLFRYVGLLTLPGRDKPILVGGHRTSETYRKVLYSLAPTLKEHSPRPILELLADYGPLTTREIAEVYSQPLEEARRELETLEAQGSVQRLVRRGGELWEMNKRS
jgi:putative protein-disulfide isomerase